MTAQLHAYMIEDNVIVQAGFISALLFLAVYTAWHRWWKTMHGRTLIALSLAVAVVLGRITMIEWHMLPYPGHSVAAGDWIILQFLAIIPITFTAMMWQLAHNRYRTKARRGHPRPQSAFQVPSSWRIYRPAGRVGWALSPQGEWFLVDERSIVADRRDPESSAQLNEWLMTGVLKPADDPFGDKQGLTDTD